MPSVASRRRHLFRSRLVTTGLFLALGTLFCFALSLGDLRLTWAQTLQSLVGHGDSSTTFVVQSLRLPRTLCAVLVGAALGISGSIFQSVTRNVLATPDIIGVNSGASSAVAVAILTFGVTGPAIAVIAVVGALGAGALMYGLAWRDGVSGYRLVLIGIGVAAFATSITSYVLTTKPALEAQRALFWLTGSLNQSRWEDVRIGLVAVLLVLVSAPLLRRWMRALELGDETGTTLGLAVERARVMALILAVVLAGLSVAIAGPVAFVALVAGPLAYRLTGRPGYLHWPAAALGALIVLAADVTGAHLLGSLQVPVGVLTAAVGAPYLLWTLARSRSTGRRG
ncbi:iron complex transport system permease protein [Nakamurella sp. UYEF19]|uniref:FecCD family ABC transporter permease n=1 Tax=Nakamurella sp. UYEF19 TaxID=1756392 RepID=UPI003397B066